MATFWFLLVHMVFENKLDIFKMVSLDRRNHPSFKVADAADHSSSCVKNENFLGFKVADGQDHFIWQTHSLHCLKNENHVGFILPDGPDLYLALSKE